MRADAPAEVVATTQPGAPEAAEPSAEVENQSLALHWGRGTDAREKGHPRLGTRLAGASQEVKYSEAQPTGVRSAEAGPRHPDHTHTHTHAHAHWEAGDWESETGDWEVGTGDWRPEARNCR